MVIQRESEKLENPVRFWNLPPITTRQINFWRIFLLQLEIKSDFFKKRNSMIETFNADFRPIILPRIKRVFPTLTNWMMLGMTQFVCYNIDGTRIDSIERSMYEKIRDVGKLNAVIEVVLELVNTRKVMEISENEHVYSVVVDHYNTVTIDENRDLIECQLLMDEI